MPDTRVEEQKGTSIVVSDISPSRHCVLQTQKFTSVVGERPPARARLGRAGERDLKGAVRKGREGEHRRVQKSMYHAGFGQWRRRAQRLSHTGVCMAPTVLRRWRPTPGSARHRRLAERGCTRSSLSTTGRDFDGTVTDTADRGGGSVELARKVGGGDRHALVTPAGGRWRLSAAAAARRRRAAEARRASSSWSPRRRTAADDARRVSAAGGRRRFASGGGRSTCRRRQRSPVARA